MSNAPKDREGNPLEPGALYAAFVTSDEWVGDPPRLVAYLYWTGAELVDEGGERLDQRLETDIDQLVRQTGATINEEMIDDSQADELLEGSAEAIGCGYYR